MSQMTSSQLERNKAIQDQFVAEKAVGQGTFGTVLLARHRVSNEPVAIKKVIQDPRFKNRELQIMKMVNHPNVVSLKTYFYLHGDVKPTDIYLHLVMEFLPETLHRACRNFTRSKMNVPTVLVKVFMYQLLKSIAYLHLPQINVCHRDIKPHNVLVNTETGVLKICDFGSAKQLNPTEPNVAYICSRYYRAPELIFGNQFYDPAVDVWSVGCIFAEMMLGEPIFRGENSMHQLVEIIKILGTPEKQQLDILNKHSQKELRIPSIKARPWSKVFREHVPPEAHDLCSRLLTYLPTERIKPYEAMTHPFFEELHNSSTVLPNGAPLPPHLFEFFEMEVACMSADAQAKLVRKKLRDPAVSGSS